MRNVTFKNLTEEQINAIEVLLGDACNIEEQIEEKEEETSFPQSGDTYFFICSNGKIDCVNYNNANDFCKNRLSLGNCFKTLEEAAFEVGRLKVLHEMKQFAEPKDYKWDGQNSHCYIFMIFMTIVLKLVKLFIVRVMIFNSNLKKMQKLVSRWLVRTESRSIIYKCNSNNV